MTHKEKNPNFYSVVVPINQSGQVLIGKRLSDGLWTTPAGGACEYETPAECAIRETFEESLLKIQPAELDSVTVVTAPNGKPVHIFLYKVPQIGFDYDQNKAMYPVVSVAADPDREVSEWLWVNPENFPLELSSPKNVNRLQGINMALMKFHGLRKAAELSLLEKLQKSTRAHVYPVGTIRDWDGEKHIKRADGSWVPWHAPVVHAKPHAPDYEVVHVEEKVDEAHERTRAKMKADSETAKAALNKPQITLPQKLSALENEWRAHLDKPTPQDTSETEKYYAKDVALREEMKATEAAILATVPKVTPQEETPSKPVKFQVEHFMPTDQLKAVRAGMRGEEKEFFIDKGREIRNIIENMPKSYETDGQGDAAVAHLHYFKGVSDFYITEKDAGSPKDETPGQQLQAYGLADLGPGHGEAEKGYISIQELIDNGVELDLHWTPKTLAEIKAEKQAINNDTPPWEDPQERGFAIGTVRTWNGIDYVKTEHGWVRVGGQDHIPKTEAELENSKNVQESIVADLRQRRDDPEAWYTKQNTLRDARIAAGDSLDLDAELKAYKEINALVNVELDKQADDKFWDDREKARREPEVEPPAEVTKAKTSLEDEIKAAQAKQEAALAAKTPREIADAKAKADKESEYFNARASEFSNLGEDLKGSARHKRGEYSANLSQMEAEGVAEKLLTRDNILKHDPLKLPEITEENYELVYLAHAAMKVFPNKPEYGANADETNLKVRVDYQKAFLEYKGKVEATLDRYLSGERVYQERTRYSSTGPSEKIQVDVTWQKFLADMQAEAKMMFQETRKNKGIPTGYDIASAYTLNDVSKALSPYGHGTRKANGKLNEFQSLVHNKTEAEKLEIAKAVILDGESVTSAVGMKRAKGFQPSDIYVNNKAERVGGSPVPETFDAQSQRTLKDMQMRGLQWGNSVTDDERLHHMKKSTEAFQDLTEVLGLPTEMASFNGRLGLAIGARGRKGASAHYESSTKVINLTRASGVGTLAHEWGHFFDNVVAQLGGDGNNYASATSFRTDTDPVLKAFADLKDSPAFQEFKKHSRDTFYKLQKEGPIFKDWGYWGNPQELFARSFEAHVSHKLASQGRKNTYLHAADYNGIGLGGGHGMWPSSEMSAKLAPHFDALFEAFKNSDMLKKALDFMGGLNMTNVEHSLLEKLQKGGPGSGVTGHHTAEEPSYQRTHDNYESARKEAGLRANKHGYDVALRKVKEYGKTKFHVTTASVNDSDYATAEIVAPMRRMGETHAPSLHDKLEVGRKESEKHLKEIKFNRDLEHARNRPWG